MINRRLSLYQKPGDSPLKTINFYNNQLRVFFRSKNTVDNFLSADSKIIQIKNITL